MVTQRKSFRKYHSFLLLRLLLSTPRSSPLYSLGSTFQFSTNIIRCNCFKLYFAKSVADVDEVGIQDVVQKYRFKIQKYWGLSLIAKNKRQFTTERTAKVSDLSATDSAVRGEDAERIHPCTTGSSKPWNAWLLAWHKEALDRLFIAGGLI